MLYFTHTFLTVVMLQKTRFFEHWTLFTAPNFFFEKWEEMTTILKGEKNVCLWCCFALEKLQITILSFFITILSFFITILSFFIIFMCLLQRARPSLPPSTTCRVRQVPSTRKRRVVHERDPAHRPRRWWSHLEAAASVLVRRPAQVASQHPSAAGNHSPLHPRVRWVSFFPIFKEKIKSLTLFPSPINQSTNGDQPTLLTAKDLIIRRKKQSSSNKLSSWNKIHLFVCSGLERDLAGPHRIFINTKRR